MKICITGKNGYIGTRLKAWLQKKHPEWQTETVSVRNQLPSLEGVDVVVHAAALVHAAAKKPPPGASYDRVNRALTLELARHARFFQVDQFIFFSSMSVYGLEGGLECRGEPPTIIEADTPCRPTSDYGQSKQAAEEALRQCGLPRLSILRPPMVYGPDCPGNYARLAWLAGITPVFPQVENRRSVLHVDNLCEMIRLLILQKGEGVFHPQNREPICTWHWVKTLAQNQGHTVYFSKPLGRWICAVPSSTVRKLFGSLLYAPALSTFSWEYRITE